MSYVAFGLVAGAIGIFFGDDTLWTKLWLAACFFFTGGNFTIWLLKRLGIVER